VPSVSSENRGGPATADDQIAAMTGIDRVGTAAADDRILAVATIDRVVAGSGQDRVRPATGDMHGVIACGQVDGPAVGRQHGDPLIARRYRGGALSRGQQLQVELTGQ